MNRHASMTYLPCKQRGSTVPSRLSMNCSKSKYRHLGFPKSIVVTSFVLLLMACQKLKTIARRWTTHLRFVWTLSMACIDWNVCHRASAWFLSISFEEFKAIQHVRELVHWLRLVCDSVMTHRQTNLRRKTFDEDPCLGWTHHILCRQVATYHRVSVRTKPTPLVRLCAVYNFVYCFFNDAVVFIRSEQVLDDVTVREKGAFKRFLRNQGGGLEH